jgi:hypothetical protein
MFPKLSSPWPDVLKHVARGATHRVGLETDAKTNRKIYQTTYLQIWGLLALKLNPLKAYGGVILQWEVNKMV